MVTFAKQLERVHQRDRKFLQVCGIYSDAEIDHNRRTAVAALVYGNFDQRVGDLYREDDLFSADGVICEVSGLGRWLLDEDGTCWYSIDVPGPDGVMNTGHILGDGVVNGGQREYVHNWLGWSMFPLPALHQGMASEVDELNCLGVPLPDIGKALAQAWGMEVPDERSSEARRAKVWSPSSVTEVTFRP